MAREAQPRIPTRSSSPSALAEQAGINAIDLMNDGHPAERGRDDDNIRRKGLARRWPALALALTRSR
jgi:hypothetical protein